MVLARAGRADGVAVLLHAGIAGRMGRLAGSRMADHRPRGSVPGSAPRRTDEEECEDEGGKKSYELHAETPNAGCGDSYAATWIVSFARKFCLPEWRIVTLEAEMRNWIGNRILWSNSCKADGFTPRIIGDASADAVRFGETSASVQVE